MTKDRRTRKNRGNGFKPYNEIAQKSHVRGNTRSNRRMKTIHNNAELANQIFKIQDKTHMDEQMFRAMEKAANAFGTQGESSLPPKITKAQRNNAIYRGMVYELMDLQLKPKNKLTNTEKARLRNLNKGIREYVRVIPDLNNNNDL